MKIAEKNEKTVILEDLNTMETCLAEVLTRQEEARTTLDQSCPGLLGSWRTP